MGNYRLIKMAKYLSLVFNHLVGIFDLPHDAEMIGLHFLHVVHDLGQAVPGVDIWHVGLLLMLQLRGFQTSAGRGRRKATIIWKGEDNGRILLEQPNSNVYTSVVLFLILLL